MLHLVHTVTKQRPVKLEQAVSESSTSQRPNTPSIRARNAQGINITNYDVIT